MPADPLQLRGLFAPVFTPFRPDGSLDLSRVERQADGLVADGVVGAFVCGTTGEGPSLTPAERKQLVERWCAIAEGRLPVIAQVGHTSVDEANALAAAAQDCGVAGIACLPPFYFKPSGIDDLTAWCGAVASAAPDLPFYYYHIPSLTNVRLPMADFLRAAERRVPTLAGLKFSDDDLADYGRCLTFAGDRYDLFFGVDEMLLAARALGARAAIGSTYNLIAPLYSNLVDSFERGDLATAQRLQSQSREIVAVFQKHGGLCAIKAAARLVRQDCGPCRPPLRTLDDGQLEVLRGDLEAAGFFGR